MKRRSGFGLTFAVGLLLAAGATFGQTAPSNLAFEVATVKPSPPVDMAKVAAEARAGRMPRWGAFVNASQAKYINMPLKALITTAYNVKGYQVTGPAWLATERFDILAKMPDGASQDDAPRMLQALLEERFKLAAHRETQEHPVLALVVGKDGPKLNEATAAAEPIDENAPLKPGEMKVESPVGPVRVTTNADGSMTINMGAKGTIKQRMDMQAQTLSMESSRMTMTVFAEVLSGLLTGSGEGRQVVDMTDLKGNYRVAVELSLADLRAAGRAQGVNPPMAPAGGGGADASPAAAASDPGGGSSVFASVQKLGLKLEKRKAEVEQLVIDHVEKAPTEN